MEININLNEEEQAIAKFIAEKRRLTNRRNKVEEKKLGPNPGMEIEIGGYGAEMAVAKAFNVYPDFTTHSRSGGYDLIIGKGKKQKRVDVKYTDNSNGNLIAPIKKGREKNGPEIYFLVIGKFPKYRLIGWCKREEFLKKENIKDIGHGPTYVLDRDQLHPFDEE